MDGAAGTGGDRGVMGDDEQPRACRSRSFEQQVDDPGTGRAVEIASRLVGQEELRARGGGAGDRYPLLFAARELRRVMGQAMTEADSFELGLRPLAGIERSGQFERNRDILDCGHGGEQVERLEDDPQRSAAKAGKVILAQPIDGLPRQMNPSGVGPLKAGDDRQQRALARARRPQHGDALARIEAQANALQYFGADVALTKGQANIVEIDQRFGHWLQLGTLRRRHNGPTFPVMIRRSIAAALLSMLLTAAAPAPERPLVLAFGDSLTAGYGLDQGLGFAPQLQATLRRHGIAAEVVDGGVSGDTSEAGKARLGWTIDGMTRKPDLVILELGANDMLRGLDPALTRANLEAMMAELKRRDIKVLVAGMRGAPNLDPAYVARFEAIYPELARRSGAALYPFFMDGVAGQKGMVQPDGMHPTFAGVKRIVTGILPAVKRALGRP